MSDDLMKGNFETKTKVVADEVEETDQLEAQFEREAMKRLGGSIAFVSKKKVDWGAEDDAHADD